MNGEPDIQRIAEIIRNTGIRLLGEPPVFGSHGTEQAKEDGSVVTSQDLKVQAEIQEQLHRLWPDISFLGEEMTHAEQVAIMEQSGGRVWVLDPIDGTTNFVSGFPFYGILNIFKLSFEFNISK